MAGAVSSDSRDFSYTFSRESAMGARPSHLIVEIFSYIFGSALEESTAILT